MNKYPPLQMTSESHLPSQNYFSNRLFEVKYMAHQGSPNMDRKNEHANKHKRVAQKSTGRETWCIRYLWTRRIFLKTII